MGDDKTQSPFYIHVGLKIIFGWWADTITVKRNFCSVISFFGLVKNLEKRWTNPCVIESVNIIVFYKETKSKIYRYGFGSFLRTCMNGQHDLRLKLLAGVDRPFFWALYMWWKNNPVALFMDSSILLWTPIFSSPGSTLSGPRIIFSQNFKLFLSVVTKE